MQQPNEPEKKNRWEKDGMEVGKSIMNMAN